MKKTNVLNCNCKILDNPNSARFFPDNKNILKKPVEGITKSNSATSIKTEQKLNIKSKLLIFIFSV